MALIISVELRASCKVMLLVCAVSVNHSEKLLNCACKVYHEVRFNAFVEVADMPIILTVELLDRIDSRRTFRATVIAEVPRIVHGR